MQRIKDFLTLEGRISIYVLGIVLGVFALCSSRVWGVWIELFNGHKAVLFSIGFLEALIAWGSLGRLLKFVLKQANDYLGDKHE